MTDEQIIEALECCITQDGTIPCYSCPCWDYDDEKCKGLSYSDILSLIARQKTEIKQLQSYNQNLLVANTALSNEILETKSEVIKVLAEKIKVQLDDLEYRSNTNRKTIPIEKHDAVVDWVLHEVVPHTISELVKEMMEVSNENL